MAPNSASPDWRTIAEQATNEMDPKNLTTLISHLCAAIDQREGSLAACRSQVKLQLNHFLPDGTLRAAFFVSSTHKQSAVYWQSIYKF